MTVNTALISKIRQIVRCFETGRVVGADYGALALFDDGPGNRKQITYGASQTTEFGKLRILLQMYIDAPGAKFAAEFRTYISRIGDLSRPSLSDTPAFVKLLKDAAKDPVMHQTQDRFFNIHFFNPARAWADRNGFKLPLSLLVIYDSHVHSGTVLDFLRNRFAERTPSRGGDEKKWIESYVNARDAWLETHAKQLLRNTDYRTDSFIYNIRQDNWMLDKPFQIVNYTDAAEKTTPQFRQVIP